MSPVLGFGGGSELTRRDVPTFTWESVLNLHTSSRSDHAWPAGAGSG